MLEIARRLESFCFQKMLNMEPALEFDRTAALYNHISLPLLSIEVAMLVLIVVLPTAAICGYFAGALRRKALVDAGKPVDQVVGETTLVMQACGRDLRPV